jgi:hypothetical protein
MIEIRLASTDPAELADVEAALRTVLAIDRPGRQYTDKPRTGRTRGRAQLTGPAQLDPRHRLYLTAVGIRASPDTTDRTSPKDDPR